MNDINGFIVINRKILKWGWYDDQNTKLLFLHLLLKANWQDKEWHGMTIKRGQLVTGRKQLSKELKLTEQQVRTSLEKLISTSEVTKITTNKYTVITINNYDKYQNYNQENSQQTTNKQPTNNQQTTTTKQYNNITTKQNNKLNEFNLYNNFSENLQCDCIAKSTKQRCTRKSSFNINGKNYCNQHARDLIPNITNEGKFNKPSIEEIAAYCEERKNNVNAEMFYDFYESKNWYVGKNKMIDWKASVRTWEKRNEENKKQTAQEKRFEMYRRLEEEYDNKGN